MRQIRGTVQGLASAGKAPECPHPGARCSSDPVPGVAQPVAFLACYLERQFIASQEFWTLQESSLYIIFQNLKCTFWKKNEPVYLTATASAFLCCFFHSKFCTETESLSPSLLCSFQKRGDWNFTFQHFSKSCPKSEIYMKSCIFFIFLLI